MIQVNATLHTKGGVTIATGSLLNVKPHFRDRLDENGLTHYDIAFDVDIYKNMAEYQLGKVLINDELDEFNVGYTETDVDMQALTSVTQMIALLVNHVEEGDEDFDGVGSSNTAIVYPPIVT